MNNSLLPDSWKYQKLGEVGTTLIGLTYSPSNVSEFGTLVLRSSNIQNNQLAFDNNVFVDMELPERVIVKEKDLLICVRNGSRNLIGKCTLIDKKTEGSAFGAFMSIYRSSINEYVFHVFQSEVIQKQIRNNLGATINQITNNDLANFYIPVPPLSEQQKIAQALTDTDNYISALEKLIEKKKMIKEGLMVNLLTGKQRLKEFAFNDDGTAKGYKDSELGKIPEDWEIFNIGDLLSITTGDKNTQDKVSDGAYPFFVRSQTIETSNTYSFDGEGVLTAGDGVGTGKIFHYINGKCDIHQRVYLMSNFHKKLHGYFFYLYFSRNFYNRIMSMTAKSSVDSVRKEMIADMKIYLPILEEQIEISKLIQNSTAELNNLEQKLSKFKKIKQGMMQKLLTGEIRLA